MEEKRITIIIPAYNESENLPKVLPRFVPICADLSSMNYETEILVINDGSSDNTEEIALQLGAKVISHPFNLGYGASLQTGYRYADRAKSQIVVTIDADGQHNPEDILKLLRVFIQNDDDVVIGSRFIQKSNYKISIMKKIGVNLFSFVAKLLTNKKIYDVTSGFQVIKREPMLFLMDDFPHDYPDVEIIILLTKSGYKIEEVQVTMNQRISGKSMHTFLSSIKYPFRSIIAIIVVLLKHFMAIKRGKK